MPTWSKKTTINKINKAFETHGHMLHAKTKLKGCSSFSTKKTKSSRHGNDEKNLAGGATGEWPTLASATPATFTLQLGIQAAPVNFSFLVSKIHHQATTTTVIKKKKSDFVILRLGYVPEIWLQSERHLEHGPKMELQIKIHASFLETFCGSI